MNIKNIGAKAHQSQEKLDQIFAEVYKKDYGTGTDGYRFEMVVRQLISAKGIRNEVMASAGKVDQVLYLKDEHGKLRRTKCEIKTSTGIVAQYPATFGDTIENHSVAEVYPDADLIFYAARASEFEDLDDLLDETIVLKVPNWAAFMIENSGKRKHEFGTAFKLAVNNGTLREKNQAIPARPVLDKKGNPVLDEDGTPKMTKRGLPRWTDCIVIQEAYREQIADAIQANLETHEYETLGEWLERNGRA